MFHGGHNDTFPGSALPSQRRSPARCCRVEHTPPVDRSEASHSAEVRSRPKGAASWSGADGVRIRPGEPAMPRSTVPTKSRCVFPTAVLYDRVVVSSASTGTLGWSPDGVGRPLFTNSDPLIADTSRHVLLVECARCCSHQGAGGRVSRARSGGAAATKEGSTQAANRSC